MIADFLAWLDGPSLVADLALLGWLGAVAMLGAYAFRGPKR